MKLLIASLLLACSTFAGTLPKVLIIGDSISMGYTPVVQKKLDGIAEVTHPGENCQHTGFGMLNVKRWVGTNKWDVIHFNFGIWDTHLLREGGALVSDESGSLAGMKVRYSPEKYRENLTKIVEELEKTGAKLIWASTTPVLTRKGKRLDAIPKNNVIAAEVMKAHKIPVNDLYSLVLPHAKEWQSDDCHFNVTGNVPLSQQVADSIQQALNKPPLAPSNQSK